MPTPPTATTFHFSNAHGPNTDLPGTVLLRGTVLILDLPKAKNFGPYHIEGSLTPHHFEGQHSECTAVRARWAEIGDGVHVGLWTMNNYYSRSSSLRKVLEARVYLPGKRRSLVTLSIRVAAGCRESE